ncbi:hypothetical protein ABK040_005245 [Willaertia magna]
MKILNALLLLIGIITIFCLIGASLERSYYDNFDVTRLPNGATYPEHHIFKYIFIKNGTLTKFAEDFKESKFVWDFTFCMKDSDGDGWTNGDELGDPCCVWSANGEAPRRYGIYDLSDPSDIVDIPPYGSVLDEAYVKNITASPTYFSVQLDWALPDEFDNVVCWYKLQMSNPNSGSLGYFTFMYVTYRTTTYTRYNLYDNTTYSFRIVPVNNFRGYYADGKAGEITVPTEPDPYGKGIGDDCPETVKYWSEIYPTIVPTNDSVVKFVEIPNNLTVIMDVSPPRIENIKVFGCLKGSDLDDIELHFEKMVVTGMLEVGNETKPYQHKFIITLHGNKTVSSGIGIGNKYLAVTSGGVLKLHGKKHHVTWTLLSKTASVGDTIITLVQETLWEIGDEIVISSTDFDKNQAERRIITKRINASTFEFEKPLVYMHYGELQYYIKSDGRTVTLDERAAVGLLSHNIVVQGDEESEKDLFGGHTIYMRSSKFIRLENTEFRRMGQAGVLGRYPVHFHMFGNASTSYVKKLSIHDTYQRAITFHAVNYLHAEGIVAYNNFGHAFFLEDAVEEHNIIENNLGLVTKAIPDSRAILTPSNFDAEPATFWITNPNNILINNHAGGSDGHGIWYQLSDYSSGPNMSPYFRPRMWYWGKFYNNTVHSNGIHGLNTWHDFFPCTDPLKDIFEKTACGTVKNPWKTANLDKLTSFKNRKQGHFAYNQGDITMNDSVYADNPIGYTFNVVFQGKMIIQNCTFIGESQNKGNTYGCSYGQCYLCGDYKTNPYSDYRRSIPNYREEPIVGIEYQRDGAVLELNGVEFFNYKHNCQRKAMAIDVKNNPMASSTQFNYFTRNLKFHNSSELYFKLGTGYSPIYDSYKHSIITDLDGCLTKSVTEVPLNFNTSGSHIIPNNPMIIDYDKCFNVPKWNAYVCDPRVRWNRFFMYCPPIANHVDPIRVNSSKGFYEENTGETTRFGNWQYKASFLDDPTINYTVRWLGPVGTPEFIEVDWSGSKKLNLRFDYTTWGPLHLNIVEGFKEYVLLPGNSSSGPMSYDCKTNSVFVEVNKNVKIYASDAKYVPPELDCITFNNSLCSNFSNCGGPKRGKCVGKDMCVCRWGWTSDDCTFWHCAHKQWCSRHGICVGPNICRCFPGFGGDMCEKLEEFLLFTRVLAFGDIHVRSIDGSNYTFNSVGEFYLYKSNEFSLQTRLLTCTNDSNTSCMKMIAFKSGDDIVVIQSVGDKNVKVTVNGREIDFKEAVSNIEPLYPQSNFEIPSDMQKFYNFIKYQRDPTTNEIPVIADMQQITYQQPKEKIYILHGGDSMVQEIDASTNVTKSNVEPTKIITLKFSSGFKGQIRVRNDGNGWLSVTFSPAKDSNYTGVEKGGLYGTFDGNINNEFTLRNGIILTNPTSTDIHKVFGESWRVKKDESLFPYEGSESYETINRIDFEPLLQLPVNPAMQKLAEKTCSNLGLTDEFLQACIFDVVSTGRIEFAKGAATISAQVTCETDPALCTQKVCPNFCSLNGKCTSGICYCDNGWLGDDCSIQTNVTVSVSNVGAIVGIVIGSVLAGILILLCLLFTVAIFSKRSTFTKEIFSNLISVVPLPNEERERGEDYSDLKPSNIEMGVVTITQKTRLKVDHY